MQIKWGRHEEGYFETGLSFKPMSFCGPAKGDRLFYLRVWRCAVRVMIPFRKCLLCGKRHLI